MKNLLERLTPEAREKLNAINEQYPDTYNMLVRHLEAEENYFDLKWITIDILMTHKVLGENFGNQGVGIGIIFEAIER